MNKAEILNFLKIKDLKEFKKNIKKSIVSRRYKELEQVFEVFGVSVQIKSGQNKFYNC
ncbi:MAG: hypothetical protein CM1200mP13_10530 [Candidatus Pelagibacterales bacterium]|nr:MAG: hypothetical protein CM1200mP13_10530 [Pelagibacterales bacterium]